MNSFPNVFYARCYQTACPRAEQCLRRFAAVSEGGKDLYAKAVNPLALPEDLNECRAFRPKVKERVAWGVCHLWDNLPLRKATSAKAEAIKHFTQPRYYRFYREELPLREEDMNYVADLFRRYGFEEEPHYSRFSEEYCW